ncbi:ExbD/TolR family protein [Kiritimatiella glycovorans]|uniref:Biopolymer transport protein ExbD n=1 Tax=Kiritimatiella glycovorans TaxID=1307763 RepID=A0A0G3EDA6_9BACT|nr:biopolymer transporter ExbD [Kiritimatiella glycovorans]AKJ63347.1 Biopolymer transport protein ExbD [Kiritimatiella glycovorans]
MARKTSLVSLKEISEINMTPLMDLTFILLITFMITFPLIEEGIPINLPQGRAEDMDEPRSRSISIDGQRRLYLDEVPVGRAELAAEMAQLGAEEPDTTVYLRADRELPYGAVTEVLTLLRRNGVSRTALVLKGREAGE